MERAGQDDPETGGHEALDVSGAKLRLLLALLYFDSPTTPPPPPADAHLSSNTQGFSNKIISSCKPHHPESIAHMRAKQFLDEGSVSSPS